MMLRLFLCLAVFTPTSLVCQAPPGRPSPSDFWRERRTADSLAGADNAEAAEPLYRSLATADTADVQLWLALANAELAIRHFPAAESAFVHVFRGRFFAGPAAVQIARLEAARGNQTKAFDWLDSALAHRVSSRASLQRDSAFIAYHRDPRFRAIAGMPADSTLSRADRWRYDLAFFASEARRIHTGFDRPAFSPAFTAAVADLNRRVPHLSDDLILAGFQRLATLLGDGHSGVYLRNLPRGHRRLPVDFYWFAEGMYVVGARQDHRDLIGARVVRIGKLTPLELLRALEAYVPRDNPMRILSLGIAFQLDYPFQLQALGAIDDTSRVTIVVADTAGQERELTLVGDDSRTPQARLTPRDTGSANPLWLRNPSANAWMTPLPDVHAI